MSAFFVATVNVKDHEKFRLYASKAAATFAPHGGEPVLRGTREHTLVGAAHHQAVGIVRFPDAGALDAWFRSAEYQALIPLRDQAAEMTIASYTAAG